MNQPVPATLYSAALPGAGVPSRVHFIGGVLAVDGAHPQRVPAQDLRTRIGGADDDALFFDWNAGGAAFSLMLDDRAAQAALAATAPESLAPQLRRWQGRAKAQRAKWNIVVGTVAALCVAAVLVVWQSERVAGWIADSVPVSTEVRLGKSALREIKANRRITQEGPAAEAVKSIGQRLTQGSKYSYEWYVLSDDSVNAFALPGGLVIVHTALLEKTRSPEELAGVLAHEVQHIEQRHSLRQMIHSAGLAVVLMIGLGDVSAFTAVVLHQAGNLRHGRSLESQADLAAVAALVKARISPKGMASFFKEMSKEAPDSIELLSSHPLPADRLKQIETAVAAQPCDCQPLQMDWAAVQADAEKVR